jgi:hypothetical protein
MPVVVFDTYVTVEGPKKKEVVDLQIVSATTGIYVSQLQNPEFATFVGTNTNKVGLIVISDREVAFVTANQTRGILTVYGF